MICKIRMELLFIYIVRVKGINTAAITVIFKPSINLIINYKNLNENNCSTLLVNNNK